MTGSRRTSKGITVLEMAVVCLILFVAASVSYPSAAVAAESVRLQVASEDIRTLLLSARNFSDRHREAVLLRIQPAALEAGVLSEDGRWQRRIRIHPSLQFVQPLETIEAVLLPGGGLPHLAVVLASPGGARSGFRVDPLGATLTAWGGAE